MIRSRMFRHETKLQSFTYVLVAVSMGAWNYDWNFVNFNVRILLYDKYRGEELTFILWSDIIY